MMTATDKELDAYIKLLNAKQKKSLLSVVKSYLLPNEQKAMSIEEYNKEIDEGEAAIDRGEFYTHEEVIEMSKSWILGKQKG